MNSATPVILFRRYKHQDTIGENLQKLMAAVYTFSVSTAECGMGFSTVNAILTDKKV